MLIYEYKFGNNMKTSITIGNVCFLFNTTKDEVLLLKRSRFPMQGMWTGVGGKTNLMEDINLSCIREIKEETNFNIDNVVLKGVIKTILDETNTSWLLFVYTSITKEKDFHKCDEGELKWIPVSKIENYQLIGFIKEIFSYIVAENSLIEGTIIHDKNGKVLKKTLHIEDVEKYA